jgi:hypothetical protein
VLNELPVDERVNRISDASGMDHDGGRGMSLAVNVRIRGRVPAAGLECGRGQKNHRKETDLRKRVHGATLSIGGDPRKHPDPVR